MNNDLNNNIGSDNSQLSNNQPITPVTNEQPVAPTQPTQSVEQPTYNQNFNEPIGQPINNTPNYNEPINQPLNPAENTNIIPNNSSKFNKKTLIIIIVAVIILIAVVAFIFLTKGNNESGNFNDSSSSSAFFLSDSNSKYALFNDNGDQLTKFIFDSVGEFINGAALVEKDDKEGIINTKGKMTVDFGKYRYMDDYEGIYQVGDNNDHDFIINGQGKVLYDLENKDLLPFTGKKYSLLEDKKAKTYEILNYEGKVVEKFSIVTNAKKPEISVEDGYATIYYNNKNILLDNKTSKEIVSFNDENRYCVEGLEGDGKTLKLEACVTDYGTHDEDHYKYVRNGKLYDVSDKCDRVIYEDGSFICSKDYYGFLLDEEFNVGMSDSSIIYINSNTYVAEKNGTFGGLDFYENGKLVGSVQCRTFANPSKPSTAPYLLKTYYSRDCGTDSTLYEFYDTKGNKQFNKMFIDAEKFDANGLAIVSEVEDKYYLIDSTGKKVSEDYNDISATNAPGYYTVKKDNFGIIDKEGNKVLDCLYKQIYVYNYRNTHFAVLSTTDNTYVVYDLKNKKEILKSEKTPSLYENYISVSKNNKTQYYSYTGKLLTEN